MRSNGKMYKSFFVNEKKYRNLIGETMHYPVFLNQIKENVSKQIIGIIKTCIKKGTKSLETEIQVQTEYTDSIVVKIKLFRNDEEHIYSMKSFNAEYYNEKPLKNGKLNKPTISITTLFNKNGIFPEELIEVAVHHEITHLFDDWVSLKKGSIPIGTKSITKTTHLLKELANLSQSEFFDSFWYVAYLSSKSEQTAFLSQTFKELENLDTFSSNYKLNAKRTVVYNNFLKGITSFKKEIQAANENELTIANNILAKNLSKATIPSCRNNPFNPDKYRDTLHQWADKVFERFLKKYYTVIAYYLETIRI